jgi:hypothetical protein
MTAEDPMNPALSEADQHAVDALIEHGFDVEAAKRAHPAEAARIDAAYGLLTRAVDGYPTEAPDPALVDLTLARIEREESAREDRMKLAQRGSPTLGRGRWSDFIAVACVAVLAVSIGLPLATRMRAQSQIAGCADNLRALGLGLSNYHNDFKSRPIAAGFAPDLFGRASWDGYDNSRHMDLLHQLKYCSPDCASCRNNDERDGYASQVVSERADGRWLLQNRVPLVADRNPLVPRTAAGGRIQFQALDNSPDHGGRGENVLFGDLSVSFENLPVLLIQLTPNEPARLENIWLPADSAGSEDDLHSPSEWNRIDVFLLQ